MNTHRSAKVSVVLALVFCSPLAMAQQKPPPNAGRVTDDIKIDKNPSKNPDGTSKANRGDPSHDRATDSTKQVAPQTTTIAGEKAVNKDEDLDVAVGKTEVTSVEQTDPNRKDVIESRAEARREGEGRRFTAAPLVGYGFNDLGFGIGGRLGYTFDKPIYVGGTFMYHNGDSGVASGPGVTSSGNNFLYPGVEGGYDIGIGPVLVRPYVGAGVLIARTSVTAGGVERTTTDTGFMLYPGVNAHYIIGKTPIFVGGDARVLLPFDGNGVAPTLLGTAGLHL